MPVKLTRSFATDNLSRSSPVAPKNLPKPIFPRVDSPALEIQKWEQELKIQRVRQSGPREQGVIKAVYLT